MKTLKPIQVNSLGMPLEKWEYKSCTALIGTGDNWATIYSIGSAEQGKGHASKLLQAMKEYYAVTGKVFGSSVALNNRMAYLLKKFDIIEYQ